jgi:methylglyoxal synthase
MTSDQRTTDAAEPDDQPEALRAPIRHVTMSARKRIVLIGHDNRKHDLLEWARFNRDTLVQHELYGTGTTGELIASELGLTVHRFLSGPLGGDQQVGAGIAEERLDLVIFFWDPLQSQPHDVSPSCTTRPSPAIVRRPTSCSPAR